MAHQVEEDEKISVQMTPGRNAQTLPATHREIQPRARRSSADNASRRRSDAQELFEQSVQADDVALGNITRDLLQRNAQSDQISAQSPAEYLSTAIEHDVWPEPPYLGSTSEDRAQTPEKDDEFCARMRNVRAADIEAVQRIIHADTDSTIRQIAFQQAPLLDATPTNDYVVSRFGENEEPRSESSISAAEAPEIDAMMADLQLNPTYDLQYTIHQGSRGISPPPEFDDASIPAYQDSSDVPSYATTISQFSQLPVELSFATDGTLTQADRPTETDKFMNAHIARHGSSSLSPLALLTPAPGDDLPVYAQSDQGFPDTEVTFAGNSEVDDAESRKAKAAVDAVRIAEENEALEALIAAELQEAENGFDSRDVQAMRTFGDDPTDYYSAEDISELQELTSDPLDAELHTGTHFDDEAELLQLMAQYARRSPHEEHSTSNLDDTADSKMNLAELKNMLRDRSLTKNEKTVNHGSFLSCDGKLQDETHQDFDSLESMSNLRFSHPELQNSETDKQAEEAADDFDTYLVQIPETPQKSQTESAEAEWKPSVRPAQHQQQVAGFGGGHGVTRTVMDATTYSAFQEKKTKKAATYMKLEGQVAENRRRRDYSLDAFHLTTKLLLLNPEYYSIWNYRREIMLRGLFPGSSEQETQDLLNEEIKRLQGIMSDYPKVYWIWTHRKWCLAQCPWPDWSKEILLVSKMLERDARNFHVWEYRRFVIARIEAVEVSSKATREFDYTTGAINSNFSNFSAWHNRTKLIPQLLCQLEDDVSRESRRKEMLQQELDLIKGAIYTDPDDQSVWLYHRWLLNPDFAEPELHPLAPTSSEEHAQHLQQELAMIEELMEEEPDNVWCTYATLNYGTALSRISGRSSGDEDLARHQSLLKVLEKSDHLRQGRYRAWNITSVDA